MSRTQISVSSFLSGRRVALATLAGASILALTAIGSSVASAQTIGPHDEMVVAQDSYQPADYVVRRHHHYYPAHQSYRNAYGSYGGPVYASPSYGGGYQGYGYGYNDNDRNQTW